MAMLSATSSESKNRAVDAGVGEAEGSVKPVLRQKGRRRRGEAGHRASGAACQGKEGSFLVLMYTILRSKWGINSYFTGPFRGEGFWLKLLFFCS